MTQGQPEIEKSSKFGWAFLFILLFTLSPLLVMEIARMIGAANGCDLSKGGGGPCVVLGLELGSSLNRVGWSAMMLSLLMVPAGLFAMLIWFIALMIKVFTNR